MIYIIQKCLTTFKPRIITQIQIQNFLQLSSYKSAYCLENLHPKSNLNLYTPTFVPEDPTLKFNGYIPIKEIDITYSSSSGPGGQNVNKVSTKVDVRFNIKNASWLSDEIKEKIPKKYQNHINKEGYLIVKSDLTRSQQLNLADALQKLRKMIRELNSPSKKLSFYAQEKHRQRKIYAAQERVYAKRRRSEIKNNRQALCHID